MAERLLISAHPNFRLDADLRKRIDAYCRAKGLTASQGLRILLDKGLNAEGAPAFGAVSADVREGIRLGLARVKAAVGAALEDDAGISKGKR